MILSYPSIVHGRLSGRALSPALHCSYSERLPQVDCSAALRNAPEEFLSQGASWWMEVGFGNGVHLQAQLRQHSHVHFLGVEVFRPGIARCLKVTPPEALHRLHIFPKNVHDLMPHLPYQSLEKIFILFPDPWPKRRHHKRRLLQISFLKECWRSLKPSGQLIIASDVPDLVEWMQYMLAQQGKFTYLEGAKNSHIEDWPAWPEDFPLSNYARKAVHKTYFIWKKE
jgi:tRNA (guanine-N7-)-methyltransferase